MTAGRASPFQPSKERALPLPTRDELRRAGIIQIGILMLDDGQRVIAALANGPHDDAHQLAGTVDVDGRNMQPLAWHEEERAKRPMLILANANRLPTRTAPEQRKIRIRRFVSLAQKSLV